MMNIFKCRQESGRIDIEQIGGFFFEYRTPNI